ncbi:RDD family protein [Clostridium sp.]|uniref:RDD family protein n=1 Tax=Clostridium sp. TaxID=1506 RepID=UPI003216AAB0
MVEKDENLKEEVENLEEQSEKQGELVENLQVNGEEVQDILQVIDSYVDEEDKEEIQIEVVEKKKCRCGSRLGANIIDQAIGLAVSFVLLYVFNIIIRFFGYRVADKVAVFLIIYVLFNVLYGIILEATKLRKTIGKSIFKL